MPAIAPPVSNELILTESRTMRTQTIERTDVLDKVKALSLLPDGIHASTEMAAAYYEVGVDTVKSVILRNREELTSNGMHVLRGTELREFKRETEVHGEPLFVGVNSLRLFTRRALLNLGQLLTESDIARQVRRYLLNAEQVVRQEIQPRQINRPRGMTVSDLRATFFGDVAPRQLDRHLYDRGYLIDQRKSRINARGELRDGYKHRHPTAMGSRWFQLPEGRYVDANGHERGGAVIRPDRVHELVDRLIAEGLQHNSTISRGPSRLALTSSTEVVDGHQIEFRRGA